MTRRRSSAFWATAPIVALGSLQACSVEDDRGFEFDEEPGVDEPRGGSSPGGSSTGGAPADPRQPAEGSPCETSGSACNEECLLSCGTADCVDACCTNTTVKGVMCGGICGEPRCLIGDAEYWEEIAALPWICYEAEIGGKPFCGCSNYYSQAELEDEGAHVVPSCEGVYCAFYDDEGNIDCQCRGSDKSIPLNCHHVPEVGCGLGQVPDCDSAPIPTCENPCAKPVYR
jgi:hypothetical protein